MLDNIIKKLSIIITLCIILVAILYFTPLYDIVNVEIEKKVEELKEDTKENIHTTERNKQKKCTWLSHFSCVCCGLLRKG